MITIINNIHLQIDKRKDVYQVFANRSLLPSGDLEWDGDKWVFVQPDVFKELKEIESEISDFIEKKAN